MKEIRKAIHFLSHRVTSGIYPAYSQSTSSLQSIYKQFNQKYFKGILPPVSFSLTFEGEDINGTSVVERGSDGTCDYSININPKCFDYKLMPIDVLLHEMIHIEQYVNIMELDRANADKYHNNGNYHRGFFEKRVNELNSHGFQVPKSNGIYNAESWELDVDYYLLEAKTPQGYITVGENEDFRGRIDSLLATLNERIPVEEFAYIKTSVREAGSVYPLSKIYEAGVTRKPVSKMLEEMISMSRTKIGTVEYLINWKKYTPVG